MAGKNDDDKKGNDDLEKRFTALAGIVESLAKGQADIVNSVKSLTSSVQEVSNANKEFLTSLEADGDVETKRSVEAELPADLESLDRKGFLNVILNEVNKSIGNLADDIKGEVSSVSSKVETTTLKTELESAASKHPDFMHLKEEIMAEYKNNPNASVEDLYHLAKAKNPEKVAEINKTLEEEKSKSEEEAKRLAQEQEASTKSKGGFGGLTPTSGTRDDKPANLDAQAAASSAWDEVMAGIDLEATN